jgi:ribonuclease HI
MSVKEDFQSNFIMTHIYTDGACLLNTQGDLAIGLYGFYNSDMEIFVIDDQLSFGTTSYIMELKALQMALEHITTDAIIFCDSMQVIDNITTKGKNPNTEFESQIRRLFELKNKTYNITIQWVKSHSDNVGNNTIDQKLEREMVRLIHTMEPKYRNLILDRVQIRYQDKGAFESFSTEFFEALIKI